MTPTVERTKKALEDAGLAFLKAVSTAQKRCKHKDIVECEYEQGYFSTHYPIRVCKSCGISEEGWGSGYHVLGPQIRSVPMVSRSEVYQLREGLIIDHGMKGPLLRKEITLSEIIDGKPYKKDESDS